MSEPSPKAAAVARTGEGTDQANVLRPEPIYTLTGKLFYKRVWDYNTSKDTEKFREYLPGARVELHVKVRGGKGLERWQEATLTTGGRFVFTGVPAPDQIAIKVLLEHAGNITKLKGNENLVDKVDYQLKTGAVIWRRFDLDLKRLRDSKTLLVDFGDVEIKPTTDKDADFASLCDTYKTIWRGHSWIKEKTGHKLRCCPVNYPVRTISYEDAGQLYLLPGDIRDADVILHEYGHYIGQEILGGLTTPGYEYNDDAQGQHGPKTEEHYESAWNEGHATFLSSAINDDPIYHDGYDANLTMNLKTDNITIGPHCEGSIQCALWDMHKTQGLDFKKGFWKAFKSKNHKADTIFSFYDNWKAEGCPGAAKLRASLVKFKLDKGYRYTRSLLFGSHPLDPAKPKGFSTLDQLYDAYGKVAGGTLAKYKEEFYNRNRYVGGGAFAPGATVGAFTLIAGTIYIVPERFEIT
jgi:hypothetical protein